MYYEVLDKLYREKCHFCDGKGKRLGKLTELATKWKWVSAFKEIECPACNGTGRKTYKK